MKPYLIRPDIINLTPILEAYGVTYDEVLSKSRTGRINEARMVAIYLMYENGYSQGLIAEQFNRERSTMSNAIKRIKAYCDSYPEFRQKIIDLEAKVFSKDAWN
jgi:chromosomal replication initiation ATPase DnaA